MVAMAYSYQLKGIPVLDAGVESHENAFGNKTNGTILVSD